jgi:hypothetical protein
MGTTALMSVKHVYPRVLSFKKILEPHENSMCQTGDMSKFHNEDPQIVLEATV